MKPVHELLSGISNIKLIAPLAYPAFVWLMHKSYLIITDSGGVQEEAPAIQKPVLVMREVTERPEAVLAGTVKLVGTDVKKIRQETELLLHDLEAYQNMTSRTNPYGDGTAAKKIVAYFREN
jgi:UDP-N-acetylglucosamine 2-epimerase (non-hydrolysing)